MQRKAKEEKEVFIDPIAKKSMERGFNLTDTVWIGASASVADLEL